MTMARRFVTLIIAGAAVALAPSVATAGSSVTGKFSTGPVSAEVVATVGNGANTLIVQNSKVNGAAIGSIGIGTSQTIVQKGLSNTSLEISIGTPLGLSP